MELKNLSDFITQIEGLTNKPEKYLSLQDNEADIIKVLTKNLYNFTKETENLKNKRGDVLEKLVIKNLDEEQIWQQVELQNNLVCNNLVSDIAHLMLKKDNLKFPIKESEKKKLQLSENKVEQIFYEDKNLAKKRTNTNIQKMKSSIVDDKFFKLHEMENFLEKIERGEESDGSDDAEIDFFEDDSKGLNDDSAAQIHYSDFFDQPQEDSNFQKDSCEKSSVNGEKKKVKFRLTEDEAKDEKLEDSSDSINYDEDIKDNIDDNEDDEDDDDNDDDHDIDGGADDDNGDNEGFSNFNKLVDNESEDSFEEKDNEIPMPLSNFDARQERIKTRIQKLEEEALKEKPWQLKGEVTAGNRPQNSLLEEYVEFDIATRPAPVLTENSTLKLEDVILQRIKNKAWDDVIRKIKPVECDMEYKKKLVLDQEKSKLSLAQIYEQEYLKQLDNKSEEAVEKPEVEAAEHQEIRIMMNKLFSKLDALSNFHFTPKQVAPEVKIISNLPAINMEEVAPVATSDATLLAPEEVKSKSKGDLVGKSERTTTDKKRERRQKKLKQKLKYKQMEAKAKQQCEKPESKDSHDKKISQKFLQKLTKSSNVIQLEKSDGGKYVKSSNAFFSKLQDERSHTTNKKNLDVNKTKAGNAKVNSKKSRIR